MEEILTLLIPVTFVAMVVLERIFPGRKLPKVRFWLLKGFVFFAISAVLNALLPMGIATVLQGKTLLHLAWLGTIAGGVLGFIATDIVGYVVHRTLHNVHFLWRWTHQMHHSAERLDMAGAAYFHPFDFVAQIGMSTLAILLLGLTPDAAALAGFIGFFYAMFQHLNIKTPRWLGYVIQRPEAHAVHHGRGIHAYNYGNFPLWDLLFGTFRNPERFDEACGFWDGASSKMGAMLVGRDVAEPPKETVSQEMEVAPAE